MKLYLVNGSPNSQKVLSVVKHLNLSLDIEWLDFTQGDMQKPAFKALNPNGKVPVLVQDDFVLWESNAIITYLANQIPNQTLFPADNRTQADINRWLFWEAAHYNSALGDIAFQAVAKPQFGLGEPDQHWVDVSVNLLKEHASVLDSHLANKAFMVGQGWTLADYAIGHIEMFVGKVPFPFEDYPNLLAFYERLRENPHWQASAPRNPEETGKVPSVWP